MRLPFFYGWIIVMVTFVPGQIFAIAIAMSALSAVAIWMAAPRKIRAVPGRCIG